MNSDLLKSITEAMREGALAILTRKLPGAVGPIERANLATEIANNCAHAVVQFVDNQAPSNPPTLETDVTTTPKIRFGISRRDVHNNADHGSDRISINVSEQTSAGSWCMGGITIHDGNFDGLLTALEEFRASPTGIQGPRKGSQS